MNHNQSHVGKKFGFYVTIGIAFLAIVTAFVYYAGYGAIPRFMSWPAFYLLLAGAVVSVVLLFTPLNQFGPAVLALASLVSLLLFIKIIYNYVAVVMVGIDLANFDPEFLASTVMFVLTFLASVMCLFLPQRACSESKKEEK